MTIDSPKAYYEQRIISLTAFRQTLVRKRGRLAWFRLFAVLGAIASGWLIWPENILLAIVAIVIFIAAFIRLILLDIMCRQEIENTDRLITINNTELQVLAHDFHNLPDGSHFADMTHPYTHDLDIFGRSSLYQYLNRTNSEQGQAALAKALSYPAEKDKIAGQQEAARELAAMPEFCQQLQATGKASGITLTTEEKIIAWAGEEMRLIHKPSWQAARFILPLISFTLLILYIAGLLPGNLFSPAIIIMMALSYAISRMAGPVHNRLSRISGQLNTLSESIRLIEKTRFSSPALQEIKASFDQSGKKASGQISELTRILERLDYRLNFIIHIPLNTFLFWDLQQLFALEKWREQHRATIHTWFAGLAKMELAVTTGTLTFNHPGWAFPEVVSGEGIFEASALGHPLIPEGKRVNNDFATDGTGVINLVTGSNMAGKSTFLRSIGLATVLAGMGAPVCASRLRCSSMKLMSSMRISDNLEESTSTFYAELKKLKEIIQAVNNGERVFLLLDEILRGTNSADRHAGSKALVRQLVHHGAAGLVATHDLELARLAEEMPSGIRNYHFDVQVSGEELYFDYQLKTGICQSMNASILMKKIGIEL